MKTKLQKINPIMLKKHLDNKVIGQDTAKKQLCMAIQSQINNYISDEISEYEYKKNLFLIGPQGCGKSETILALKEILPLPIVTVDAFTLRQKGDKSVEYLINKILKASKSNVEIAKHAIIVIENLDNALTIDISKYIIDKDGVNLVNTIEGMISDEIEIELNFENDKEKVLFNFENNMFIITSVLQGIESLVKYRKGTNKIGFSTEKIYKDLYEEVEAIDLINYGFSTSFIASFDSIIIYKQRTKDEIVEILFKSDIINYYKTKFLENGINLKIEKEAIINLADYCNDRKLGLFSIRNIIEKKMTVLAFDNSLNDNEKNINIKSFLDV